MRKKALIVHNFYGVSGGEDVVFRLESKLLASEFDVIFYVANNNKIDGFFSRISALLGVFFSLHSFFCFVLFLRKNRPDIVHVHNYFPLISPSIFYACKFMRIPVLHTLHNFRAICPTATLMWDGKIEEISIRRGSFWAVPKRVYRGSLWGTMALVFMIELHKKIGTWRSCVDGYVALTEFSRFKFIEAGWPAEKIFVKPNFTFDKGLHSSGEGRYALYVGRLSEEKGIDFIINAFAVSGFDIKLVGDGPLIDQVESASEKYNNISYLGRLNSDEVSRLMCDASCLVMSSTWYEGFPMVIVEALSCALPIIVPKLGNMAAIVEHGVSGMHYAPGNIDSFNDVLSSVMSDFSLRQNLSSGARASFLASYTEEINLKILSDIYNGLIGGASENKNS